EFPVPRLPHHSMQRHPVVTLPRQGRALHEDGEVFLPPLQGGSKAGLPQRMLVCAASYQSCETVPNQKLQGAIQPYMRKGKRYAFGRTLKPGRTKTHEANGRLVFSKGLLEDCIGIFWQVTGKYGG